MERHSRPAGFAVQLVPGRQRAERRRGGAARAWTQLQPSFPQGVEWFSPYDTHRPSSRISIEEVVKTLAEAMVLVFLVMLLFLQNFRATLIPTLVIPVALLGTFLGMYVLGFTINQLTLFGMVLAIGIVVDDAIVVIENVERIMTEEGLSPKEATRKAMDQITGAVIAITVVLAAVFIPSALQGGAAGEIYKQFALTIAMAMVLLRVPRAGLHARRCARRLLKPSARRTRRRNLVFRIFNKYYDKVSDTYVGHIGSAVRACAALDDGVRACWRSLCGFLFIAHAGQLPARRRPGLCAGDRAAAAGRDAAAHQRGVRPDARRAREAWKASTA